MLLVVCQRDNRLASRQVSPLASQRILLASQVDSRLVNRLVSPLLSHRCNPLVALVDSLLLSHRVNQLRNRQTSRQINPL